MSIASPTTVAPRTADQPAQIPQRDRAGGSAYATPAARRKAGEHDLSILEVADASRRGRVSLSDVADAVAGAAASTAAAENLAIRSGPAVHVSRSHASLSVEIEVRGNGPHHARLVHSIVEAVRREASLREQAIGLGVISHRLDAESHRVLAISGDLSIEGFERLLSDDLERAVTAEAVVVHDFDAVGAERATVPLGKARLSFASGSVREVLGLRPPLDQTTIARMRVLELSVTFDSEETSMRVASSLLGQVRDRMGRA